MEYLFNHGTERPKQESTVSAARRVKGQICSLGILLCASDHADECINNISTGKPRGYLNTDKRRQLTLPTTASSSVKKKKEG